jgi:hypothetical protein
MMRTARTVLLLLAVATGAHAQPVANAFSQMVYFPNAPDFKLLAVKFRNFTKFALDSGNDCADKNTCATMYRLEHRDNFRTVSIVSVVADLGANTLTVALETPPTDVKALVLVAYNVKAKPKGGYLELPIKPQLMQLDVDETERFEGLRSQTRLQYQSLTPADPPDLNEDKSRSLLSSALSITDPSDFDRPYTGRVTSYAQDSSKFVHEMVISGAPRGKKLNIQVGGLETFSGAPLQASTTAQSLAVPKGRDDATFFLRIAAEENDVKGERKYSLDARVRDAWMLTERWQIAPTLDATVGNTTSKAPNTGAISSDFRYFFRSPSSFRSRIVFAPVFRTDRDFVNEDLGADVAWEMVIPSLDKSLEQRRKEEKRRGGPPLSRVWGWSVRPILAFEVGRHIKSSSADVDDDQFSRLRGSLVVTLERGRWKLATSGVLRHLLSDEVLLQDGGVIATSASEKRFGRADLSYDFGTVALTLTHMNGRQPPAYSPTDSTSLGIAFKF